MNVEGVTVPAAPGVAHNYHLYDRMNALRSVMNTGHILRLWQNDFTPAPDSTIGAFVESNFPGYAGVSLVNDFLNPPVELAIGQYQIAGTSHAFAFTAGTPQWAFGWYITDPADVKFSYRFPSAVWMTNGVTIDIQPLIQDWSYTVVP